MVVVVVGVVLDLSAEDLKDDTQLLMLTMLTDALTRKQDAAHLKR